MDYSTIMQDFQRISWDARKNPEEGCWERASDLAIVIYNIMGQEDELKILKLIPDKGTLLKPAFLDTAWFYHYSVQWNKIVWDPSYGSPLDEQSYLPFAFCGYDKIKICRQELKKNQAIGCLQENRYPCSTACEKEPHDLP